MLDLTDDGYEDVRLLDSEGREVHAARLDLWEVHNRLVDLQGRHKGQPAYELHAAIAAYLTQELGFPEVSHKFAANFMGRIYRRVDELKNSLAGGPSPGSPASTASTPSA